MTFSRRTALTGALSLVTAPALAKERLVYRDWDFDFGDVGGALAPDLIASFKAQIDIVEDLPIKASIKAFWRKIPVRIDPATRGGPGVYVPSSRWMMLSMIPQRPQNPVFLHELIHAYHHQKLPDGFKNADIIKQWNAAKITHAYPADAYMLSNPGEFLAMCASVVLWGKAARPPSTREGVKTTLPKTHAWIVKEFGFTEPGPSAQG